MRQCYTAVIERNIEVGQDFTTEPYEAGWAGEARWFVRVLRQAGDGAVLTLRQQVSPDGLIWCDVEHTPTLSVTAPGLYSFVQRDFGNWLALKAAVAGQDASFRIIIYLVLKG